MSSLTLRDLLDADWVNLPHTTGIGSVTDTAVTARQRFYRIVEIPSN